MGQGRTMRTGGEVIVEYLIRERVPYVFGLCGHGNVGLLVVLLDTPTVDASRLYAMTVTQGDPAWVGALAGVSLGLGTTSPSRK